MGLQSVIRWLIPREDHFWGYLEKQADVAHEAALTLRRFKEGTPGPAVRDAVLELEHAGDKLCRDMEDALARTFVTPIDREDLHRLSTELDDILDLTNGAIRAATLLGVETPTEAMGKLMDVLVRCTAVVKDTIPLLRHHKYEEIPQARRAIQQLEKEGDTVYREAVSVLFDDAGVDAKRLLREQKVLEDLENAVDYCERLSGTLANLAVKHG